MTDCNNGNFSHLVGLDHQQMLKRVKVMNCEVYTAER